jgi:hypothetical protein
MRRARIVGGICGVVFGLAAVLVGVDDWRSIGTFDRAPSTPDEVYVGLCSLKPTEVRALACVADLAASLAAVERGPDDAARLAAITSATCTTRPGLPLEARLRPDARVAMEFLVERLWESGVLSRNRGDDDAMLGAACDYLRNLSSSTPA